MADELVYREVTLLISYPDGHHDREDALIDRLADVCASCGISLEGAHSGPLKDDDDPPASDDQEVAGDG